METNICLLLFARSPKLKFSFELRSINTKGVYNHKLISAIGEKSPSLEIRTFALEEIHGVRRKKLFDKICKTNIRLPISPNNISFSFITSQILSLGIYIIFK